MPRRNTRNQSGDDSDPSIIAMKAPQRIYQLKQERDERARAIMAEAEKALASVKKRAVTYQEEKRRKSATKLAQQLKKVIELVEKRKQIEDKMLQVVADVHASMQEVEEMMLAGYKGRHKEAKQTLNALGAKVHQRKE
ncbi:T-complex protein 1, partial [Metarhizium majus ARSEF 297]